MLFLLKSGIKLKNFKVKKTTVNLQFQKQKYVTFNYFKPYNDHPINR